MPGDGARAAGGLGGGVEEFGEVTRGFEAACDGNFVSESDAGFIVAIVLTQHEGVLVVEFVLHFPVGLSGGPALSPVLFFGG